ncbi:diguanylate cyclase domain protein [Paraburkholderia xenovorans LB400]|uniref:Diguanylate cyclase/phosphodiesterase n=1 Tax=Paraburkholderia xenovorans (strain LB400) TaxID=266265 RepID=Q13LN9_PARXL|nr:EAL domain-containing protein [Paraburkholderia xenovorans]ABE35000.1 diguanylate cyclase/phosphodiesterase [Paraburkholderia xenovorans LB400]AIP37088.1 diguanylate cyclase domain protein [Paraburkholderia xenovorans LB400]
MVLIAKLRDALSVAERDPELVRSQLEAFGHQVPLLYFILLVNTAAVAIMHVNCAPAWLSIYFPAALCALCVVRCIRWWQCRHRVLTDNQAVPELRKLTWLAGLFAIAFSSWSLLLFPYGTAYEQTQVAFYMATTVVGCVFCLMHLRAAAMLLLSIVILSFSTFLVFTGYPVFIAMAVDMTLVGVALAFIIQLYCRTFADVVHAQRELQASQQKTQRLSDDNFRLASIDSLTDLPNRRSFFASLRALSEQALSSGNGFNVGLIDLDGFKQVNDIYGHASGDLVLQEVGSRLLSLAEPGIFFARLGGDEFGVLAQHQLANETLVELGERICGVLSQPYRVAGNIAELSGTIGWAAFPEAGTTMAQVFERADTALYVGKESRRGTPVIFSTEHETRIRRSSLVTQELRHADLESELFLEFQPIHDVLAQRTIGLEALGRWHNARLGAVRPEEFIRIAERTELILRITEVLLHKALDEVARWPPELYLSFNLSAIDICTSARARRLIDIVMASGVPPHRVSFEITETAVTRDFEQARCSLTVIKKAGCRVSLDDFGTGYSSLSYVHRLPFDTIKIDRSFMTDVDSNSASKKIVKSVLDLCRNLGLECVVEGLETASQVEVVKALGARAMQGYLFSRPMRASAVAEYLHTTRGQDYAVQTLS